MAEYIDRKKVIDIINTTCPDLNIPEINDSWANKLIGIIREDLVALVTGEPAADVRENVKGKWEVVGATSNYERGGFYYCSQCGARYAWGGNFCQNCGADMRDEKYGSH